MSIETVLGILSLVGVLILGIGIIAWILVRKHFRVENIDKKNSEPATTSETSDAPIDPATIARIRNAIGATDKEEVNARISEDAREKGIMVNIVDDPEKCDFILPSLFQRGDLTVAISTGGKSPALAKK